MSYVFDTSSIRSLQHFYPRVFKSVWDGLDELVAQNELISEGQQTKTEMVYQYLTGPRFRQRVEAVVEAYSSMQEDLDKER